MVQLNYAHPLQWPSHIERTPKWDRALSQTFKADMTLAEALAFLQEELNAFNVQSATLISDYQQMEQPRLAKRVGQENAIVLRFKYNDRVFEIACDKWVQAEHNIYAIHLALRNLRMVEGFGIGTIEQAFGGFAQGGVAAAPASGGVGYGGAAANANTQSKLEEWRLFLGLGPTATLEDAQAVYRRRAKLVASNQDELMKLNLAMDEATKVLRA